MVSITIRDVPDGTRAELAARAALAGKSLQEYLRSELIDLAQVPDPAAHLEQLRARKRHVGARLSAEQILRHRAADRA